MEVEVEEVVVEEEEEEHQGGQEWGKCESVSLNIQQRVEKSWTVQYQAIVLVRWVE